MNDIVVVLGWFLTIVHGLVIVIKSVYALTPLFCLSVCLSVRPSINPCVCFGRRYILQNYSLHSVFMNISYMSKTCWNRSISDQCYQCKNSHHHLVEGTCEWIQLFLLFLLFCRDMLIDWSQMHNTNITKNNLVLGQCSAACVPPQGFRCAANFYKKLYIRTTHW
jgi:hypothetical protein